MSDRDCAVREITALLEADLKVSGARTGDEIKSALLASAESLQPLNPYAGVTFKGPFQWSEPAGEGLPRFKLMFGRATEANE